jgi:hypothetical protein
MAAPPRSAATIVRDAALSSPPAAGPVLVAPVAVMLVAKTWNERTAP